MNEKEFKELIDNIKENNIATLSEDLLKVIGTLDEQQLKILFASLEANTSIIVIFSKTIISKNIYDELKKIVDRNFKRLVNLLPVSYISRFDVETYYKDVSALDIHALLESLQKNRSIIEFNCCDVTHLNHQLLKDQLNKTIERNKPLPHIVLSRYMATEFQNITELNARQMDMLSTFYYEINENRFYSTNCWIGNFITLTKTLRIVHISPNVFFQRWLHMLEYYLKWAPHVLECYYDNQPLYQEITDKNYDGWVKSGEKEKLITNINLILQTLPSSLVRMIVDYMYYPSKLPSKETIKESNMIQSDVVSLSNSQNSSRVSSLLENTPILQRKRMTPVVEECLLVNNHKTTTSPNAPRPPKLVQLTSTPHIPKDIFTTYLNEETTTEDPRLLPRDCKWKKEYDFTLDFVFTKNCREFNPGKSVPSQQQKPIQKPSPIFSTTNASPIIIFSNSDKPVKPKTIAERSKENECLILSQNTVKQDSLRSNYLSQSSILVTNDSGIALPKILKSNTNTSPNLNNRSKK